MFAVLGPVSLAPTLYAKLSHDPVQDFAVVTLISLTPQLLLIGPSSPFKSVEDLIAAARAKPGELSCDLRPSKQAERGILIDLLRIAGDCGFPIGNYRYVGMGANRFYDFLLLHNYLGIKDMVSLEHDSDMFKRAVFNVPYGFIDVKETSAQDYIASCEISLRSQ